MRRRLATALVASFVLAGCGSDPAAEIVRGTAEASVSTTTEPQPARTTAPTSPTTVKATTVTRSPTTVARTRPSVATTTPTSTSSSTSSPTTTPVAVYDFVDYSISGGIAGIFENLRAYRNGRAAFQDDSGSVEFAMTAARAAELRAALDGANFPSLSRSYGRPYPDGFEYEVAYGPYTVRLYGSSTGPASLQPLLTILGQEMERGRHL